MAAGLPGTANLGAALAGWALVLSPLPRTGGREGGRTGKAGSVRFIYKPC